TEFQLGLLQHPEALEDLQISWGKYQRLQVNTLRRIVLSSLLRRACLFEKGSYVAQPAYRWWRGQDTGNQAEKDGPPNGRRDEPQTAAQATKDYGHLDFAPQTVPGRHAKWSGRQNNIRLCEDV